MSVLRHQGNGDTYDLNSSSGSKTSERFNWWKSMKGLISRTDAGASNFFPCLILRDSRSLRTVYKLASCVQWYGRMALTFLILHAAALETFVQEPDTQADIDTHSLLLDLPGDTVLNEDIC